TYGNPPLNHCFQKRGNKRISYWLQFIGEQTTRRNLALTRLLQDMPSSMRAQMPYWGLPRTVCRRLRYIRTNPSFTMLEICCSMLYSEHIRMQDCSCSMSMSKVLNRFALIPLRLAFANHVYCRMRKAEKPVFALRHYAPGSVRSLNFRLTERVDCCSVLPSGKSGSCRKPRS